MKFIKFFGASLIFWVYAVSAWSQPYSHPLPPPEKKTPQAEVKGPSDSTPSSEPHSTKTRRMNPALFWLKQSRRQGSKTAGIVLYLNSWPDDKEKKIILQQMKEKGLEKTDEIPSYKIWIFTWERGVGKSSLDAFSACDGLLELKSFRGCRSTYVRRFKGPFSYKNSFSSTSRLAQQLGQSQDLQLCKITQKFYHEKIQCDLSGSCYGTGWQKTLAGPYWAQDMIGADLLKAELKKKV